MKSFKVFLSGLLLALTIGVQAQDSTAVNHLKFMGLEITGPVSDFANKLKGKGFSYVRTDEGVVTMQGPFTGRNVELFLVFTEKTKNIWKVVVWYPKDEIWSSIKYDFNKLKEQFVTKYGVPSNDFHFFSSPYYEGDGYEMQALKLDKCTYATYWHPENGSICVEISKYKQIKIIYEDEAGANANKAIREQSVLDEI